MKDVDYNACMHARQRTDDDFEPERPNERAQSRRQHADHASPAPLNTTKHAAALFLL